MKYRVALAALCLVVVSAVAVAGGVKDPIEGDAFRALIAAQDLGLQHFLAGYCEQGELVTGPLDPFYEGDKDAEVLFHSVRVIGAARGTRVPLRIGIEDYIPRSEAFNTRSRRKPIRGFRGMIGRVHVDGDRKKVLFLTVDENRWLVWARDVDANQITDIESEEFGRYASAVSDYLYRLSGGSVTAGGTSDEPPAAVDFGLPEAADFYAPPPDYVIDGYQNFKDYLFAHEDVRTPFARDIIAFVPGDSLRGAMIAHPPEAAWPNKEEPLIQREYRKFFDRGGEVGVMRTLSADLLQSLVPGEYFYCVGLSGEIRFGYEIPREDVERIEGETGKKLARANHAFLFPGEPVLTAGAFFVEDHGATKRIARVNAQSGHYFYSNVTATIREDIAVRSDEYLMTLGHFLAALERLGIDTEGILISKL